ncbi:MerR family transcriptional regulator [uncultured Veillonella sp.]
MAEVCKMTGLTYQTLKFYCNEGLVPYVQEIKTIIASLMTPWLYGCKS